MLLARFFLILFFTLISNSSLAIEKIKDISLQSREPVYITADELIFSRDSGIAKAFGSVEIEQDGQFVFAKQVIYDKKSDIIYAKDDVTIVRDDGTVIFADETILKNSITQGIAINFKARMGQKSLLAARNAEILDDNTLFLKDLTYSPCKICSDNLIKDTPLWQFKSKNATVSTTDETIFYKDATLELFGTPIIYTPYLSTPAPGAQRKSGFLIPRIIQSSQHLGLAVRIPYYLNISKNMDATITPMLVSKTSNLFIGQFRHLTKYGQYDLNFGVTNNDNTTRLANGTGTTSDSYEGFYDVTGSFDFKNINGDYSSRFSFDSKRIHDKAKTFLKKYKLSDELILNTDLHYSIFKDNDWYSFRALSFQDLRPNHNNKTTASAYPSLDFHKEWLTGFHGIKAIGELNYLNLSRPQGVNYHRTIGNFSLNKVFKLRYGQLLKVKGSIRADAYEIDPKPIFATDTLVTNSGIKRGFESRYHPELNTEWSIPLINTRIPNTSIILEPVINGIISPYSSNLEKGVNEDSQIPEISSSTIFEANRYKGFDRIESGHRLNYGVRGNIINRDYFENLYFVMGHNLRSKKDPNFTSMSGLDGLRSDYVSKISLQPIKTLFINNNSRINDRTYSLQRNELNLDATFSKASFFLSHFYINKGLLPTDTPRFRQQLVSGGSYNFYDKFWLEGELSTRLGKKPVTQRSKMIYDKLGIRYMGDCLYLRFTVTRDHTTLIDLKPETSYTITLNVPTF